MLKDGDSTLWAKQASLRFSCSQSDLGKDKCTIRSASSRAARPSCLIPESDTLLPSPSHLSDLSPSLWLCLSTGSLSLLQFCSSLSRDEPHPPIKPIPAKPKFAPPQTWLNTTDTCDCAWIYPHRNEYI